MGHPYATTKISHPGSLKMPDVCLAGVRVPVSTLTPQGKAAQGARTGNLKSVTSCILAGWSVGAVSGGQLL
jgi:hypothetical protein